MDLVREAGWLALVPAGTVMGLVFVWQSMNLLRDFERVRDR
jgi:hypothetical protein